MISQNTAQAHGKRKSHKILYIVLILFSVFILMPILIAAWLGFVPGLSNIFGSRDARDLGVRYSMEDLENYNQKSGLQFKEYSLAPASPFSPAEKQVLASPRTVEQFSLSQEEVTALVNNIHWYWFPVKDAQVKFSEGTLEISGKLNSEKLNDFARYISSSGNTSDNVSSAMTWLNRFAKDAPFYAKAEASIINNQLSFRLVDAEVGRLNIPLGSLGSDLQNGLNGINVAAHNFNARSAVLKDGALLFDGTYPTEIYIKQ